jgi:hypothetical protein
MMTLQALLLLQLDAPTTMNKIESKAKQDPSGVSGWVKQFNIQEAFKHISLGSTEYWRLTLRLTLESSFYHLAPAFFWWYEIEIFDAYEHMW